MRLLVLSLCLVLWNLLAVAMAVKYTVEVYVVVEDSVKQHYIKGGTAPSRVKAEMEADVKYLMQMTNKIYKRMHNRGVDMEIRIRKLDILDKNILKDGHSSVVLVDFGRYISGRRANDFFFGRMQYDVALVITGIDLKFGGARADNAGLGNINSVCTGLNRAVVEFKGTYNTAFLIAHEIGHVLGLEHDDAPVTEQNKTPQCVNYPEKLGYIMVATVPSKGIKWDFSPCSVDTLKKLNPTKACLLRTSSQSFISTNSRPSEGLLNPLVACRRKLGRTDAGILQKKVWYKNRFPSGDNVCQSVYCTTPSSYPRPYRSVQSPEGMACAAGKRCHFGECKTAPRDFPVPKDVTDKCVLGDRFMFSVFPTYTDSTCSDYFKDGTKDHHCTDPMMKENCCRTCHNKQIPDDSQCPGDAYRFDVGGIPWTCRSYLNSRRYKCDSDPVIKKACCATCASFDTSG